ncbi:MAG: hypothetical protein ACL7BU_04230 [Candidatus Phlomobacter fragariae]
MAQYAYDVSSTTLILNGHVISNFVIGTYINITKPNANTNRVIGAGSSVVIAKREDADVGDMEVHILRGSDDDIWLSNLAECNETVIFNGSIVTLYKVDGKSKTESLSLTGKSLLELPALEYSNTERNADLTYKFSFRQVLRQN